MVQVDANLGQPAWLRRFCGRRPLALLFGGGRRLAAMGTRRSAAVGRHQRLMVDGRWPLAVGGAYVGQPTVCGRATDGGPILSKWVSPSPPRCRWFSLQCEEFAAKFDPLNR